MPGPYDIFAIVGDSNNFSGQDYGFRTKARLTSIFRLLTALGMA